MPNSRKKLQKNVSLPASTIASMQGAAERSGFASVEAYLTALHANSNQLPDDDSASGVRAGSHATAEVRHSTKYGKIYAGDSAPFMAKQLPAASVDLIVTSPPFGLVRKKDYGNEDADLYLKWFEQFASGFVRLLKPSGSLVIDIGGAWKKGVPVRSLYHFELLIMLCKRFGFHLVQEFYWWNPAKLPTPAEWVTVRRVRVKDAVNCIWWLSLTPYPKASNRRVLQPYSDSMRHLLKNGYKPKVRPSGHDISDKFQNDNGGAIPPNLLAIANTESNGAYQRYCRENGLPEHPARFPAELPAYFISMLTNPGDLVLDPFGGSCVTGDVCERMQRRWICVEMDEAYIAGAKGRFTPGTRTAESANGIRRREEPYEIYPPNSLYIDDSEVPLYLDGGASRPASLNGKRH